MTRTQQLQTLGKGLLQILLRNPVVSLKFYCSLPPVRVTEPQIR